MALTLQGLPTELLLCIIDSITTPSTSDIGLVVYEKPRTKCQLFKALRATCTELNGKLLHYFGSKYFTCFWIRLTEENLLFLREISRRPIGEHVKEITINVDTLFEQTETHFDDSESDDSEDSWFPAAGAEAKKVGKCVLNEDIVKFIGDSSCARLLQEALPALRNLRSLDCAPPSVAGKMEEVNLLTIQDAWWVACKRLLNVILTATLKLDSLSIWSFNNHPLGLPLSLLEKPIVYPDWMSNLKEMYLYTVDDTYGEETFPAIVRTLTALLEKLTSMDFLNLYLTRAPASFFSQLAQALPPMSLSCVHLNYVVASFEDLQTFLKSTMPSLRDFGLSHADLNDYQDFEELMSLLISMKLTSVLLESLNVGVPPQWYRGHWARQLGLGFWVINGLRATVWASESNTCSHAEYDACDWTQVHHKWGYDKVFVKEEDDLDVAYWLQMILDKVQLTDIHDHEYELVAYGVSDCG